MFDNDTFGLLRPRLKLALLSTIIVVFFPIIGTALYISTGFIWLRDRLARASPRLDGFLFASAWAAIATLLACRLFPEHLLSRMDDIYLLGIVLTAYRFTWRSAAFLFVLALALIVWMRPPAADWSWLISFATISLCSIVVMARLKAAPAPATTQAQALRRDYTLLPLARSGR